MAKRFTIECEHCKADTTFDVFDCPDLEDHIEGKVLDAARETRDEVEGEFDDCIDGATLTGGDRPFRELAEAIRRGDRTEAELQLDRIAGEFGTRATEEVALGRYSLQAQLA